MTAGPSRLPFRRQPALLVWGWIDHRQTDWARLLRPWATDARFRPGSLSLLYPLAPARRAATAAIWCRGPVAHRLAVYPFLDLYRLFRLLGLAPVHAAALTAVLREGAPVFGVAAVPEALGWILRHQRTLHPLAWIPAEPPPA
ncbi:protein of unknown function [Candidatus Hydrogenisulfobacillus filiaventi]|uniref:Uncharacterized protein n=1 Tax=Candidatus Hydrogenisulfobacillus filiaventi TaxID=2707344 RepID=A0A6F8ZKD5_9FIRM|nr:protein of unknown function [Candidatus Hydrogenisulfobacillus filiaventi]